MLKNISIIVLVLLVAFLADRLVREDNQRYGLMFAMCAPKTGMPPLPDYFTALIPSHTKTPWFAHLHFAVTDPLPAVPLILRE